MRDNHIPCVRTGVDVTTLAEQLNLDREVVRVWFCNKRQALKNNLKLLAHPSVAAVAAKEAGIVTSSSPLQPLHTVQLQTLQPVTSGN